MPGPLQRWHCQRVDTCRKLAPRSGALQLVAVWRHRRQQHQRLEIVRHYMGVVAGHCFKQVGPAGLQLVSGGVLLQPAQPPLRLQRRRRWGREDLDETKQELVHARGRDRVHQVPQAPAVPTLPGQPALLVCPALFCPSSLPCPQLLPGMKVGVWPYHAPEGPCTAAGPPRLRPPCGCCCPAALLLPHAQHLPAPNPCGAAWRCTPALAT